MPQKMGLDVLSIVFCPKLCAGEANNLAALGCFGFVL